MLSGKEHRESNVSRQIAHIQATLDLRGGDDEFPRKI